MLPTPSPPWPPSLPLPPLLLCMTFRWFYVWLNDSLCHFFFYFFLFGWFCWPEKIWCYEMRIFLSALMVMVGKRAHAHTNTHDRKRENHLCCQNRVVECNRKNIFDIIFDTCARARSPLYITIFSWMYMYNTDCCEYSMFHMQKKYGRIGRTKETTTTTTTITFESDILTYYIYMCVAVFIVAMLITYLLPLLCSETVQPKVLIHLQMEHSSSSLFHSPTLSSHPFSSDFTNFFIFFGSLLQWPTLFIYVKF